MLSRDPGNLGPASPTADRWRLLRDRGVELTIILASPRQNGGWEEPGLRVHTSGGHLSLMRFYRMYKLGKTLVQDVDLITSEDPLELGVVAWLLSRRGKKPFELQDHAGNFEDVDTCEPFWPLRRWIARFLLPRTRVVRTVNEQSFQRLQSVYHQPSYWLPIAPDQRFLDASRGTVSDTVVCVARLVPVKRIDLLLRTFQLFHAKYPHARLMIVGDGLLKQELMQLTRRLGLSAFVVFTGSVDPLTILETARIFVLLSTHEGWGVAAVEAAAVGVPVVMTPTGCGPWLAEQGNAVLVQNTEPASIMADLEKAWTMRVHPLRTIKTRTQTADEQISAWKKYGTTT